MKNTTHQSDQRDLDWETQFNSGDQPGIHSACRKYGVAKGGGQSGDYWKFGAGNAPEIAAGSAGLLCVKRPGELMEVSRNFCPH